MTTSYQPAAKITQGLHKMLAVLLAVLLALTALPTGARPASAAPTYTITDLGTLGGCCSWANGINGAGEVVGGAVYNANRISHAFIYQGGVMRDLGELNGPYSWAEDVNSARQVVGSADSGGSTPNGVAYRHAVLWENGVVRDLGTLGGSFSDAAAINNAGQVVGRADAVVERYSVRPHAFLWENGVMHDLGTLIEPENFNSYAYDINATGQVVGISGTRNSNGTQADRAVLWENGMIRDLGTLGGNTSSATAINDAGQVVGSSQYNPNGTNSAPYHAFLWENGVMRDLGRLSGGDDYSKALAINNKGQVVGWSYTWDYSRHAFLWQNGVMRDMNDLIPADSGWELEEAMDINDAGQIVGTGRHNGSDRAFLLTPIPPDTTPPTAPIITRPANNSYNNTGNVTLSGTAEAGSTVELFDGTTSKGTATASSTGAWSKGLTGVTQGVHTYTAKARDAAGNISATSAAVKVTVDTASPAAPVISSPANNSTFNTGSFTVSGTAEAGSFVELFDGTVSKGTMTASSTRTWSKALTGVTVGVHTYTAKARDAAGNISVTSTAVRVTVNSAPVVKAPSQSFAQPSQLGTSLIPVRLTWSATDSDGVARCLARTLSP